MNAELQLARECALAAGDVLRTEFSRGSEVKADAGKDIKLAADVQAEEVILRKLRDHSPHPILSEEAGAEAGFDTGGRYWVVDPLDGTHNFSRRLPLCCVSIGLWEREEPVLGVIHDFMSGVTYEGAVGQGAWRNGEPMRVSGTADLSKASLATGFPSGRDYGGAALQAFVAQAAAFKKLRLLGTAALSLAFVAAGLVDAYYEEDIWLWDVAAGLALVRAAGGSFEVRPGKTRFQKWVFAGNGRLRLPGVKRPLALDR